MLETSDIRKGLKIKMDGQPWIVVNFEFVKPGKGNAFTRCRLKNLKTGQVVDMTFKSGEKLEEAQFEERPAIYQYSDNDNFYFMDQSTFEQIAVPKEAVGEAADFLLENMEVTVLYYENAPMSIELPNFIEATVVYSEPGVKGDTATGATKMARIEPGAMIQVPLFINEGDVIKVDTRDGTYVGRVKGK